MKTLLLILGAVILLYIFGRPILKMVFRVPFKIARFVLKHPLLLMAMAGLFFILLLLGQCSGPELDAPKQRSASSSVPAMADPKAPKGSDPVSYPKALPALPGALANGNSRFSPDLVRRMDDSQRRYYSREFFHVLNKGTSGQSRQWEYKLGKKHMFGRMTPGEAFTAGSGAQCRGFTELLAVGNEAQHLTGFACKKKDGGWCKLRTGSTLSCNLAAPRGFSGSLYGIRRSLGNLF